MHQQLRELFYAVVRTLSLSLILAGLGRAQCSVVAGTGCTGARALDCAQAPRVGQPFQICMNGGGTFGAPAYVGFFTCGPSFTFRGAPLCASAPACTLVGTPLLLVSAPQQACLVGTLPNDARLVGLSLCAQGFYTPSREPTCLLASPASMLIIQA